MADRTGKVEDAVWPMPKFYFKVTWGSTEISFSEVSGLDTEAQIVEYRHTDSAVHFPTKMPGAKKVGNVTMKRGVFVGDDTYHDWYSKIKLNTIGNGRETITIQLLDEGGKSAMAWELHNAWPIKIIGTDLKSDDNEAAIDTLEVAYETLEIRNENNF